MQARKIEPRYRRRRQYALALFAALTILLVTVGGYLYYQRNIIGSKDYDGLGSGELVMLRVDSGDSIESLIPELLELDVVASRRALILAAEHAEKEGAYSLHPGYYPLQKQMSAEAVVATLGTSALQRGMVDIPTGMTLNDVQVVGGQVREGIYTRIQVASCTDPEAATQAAIDEEAQKGTPITDYQREIIDSALQAEKAANLQCVTADQLRDAVAHTDPAILGVPEWAQNEVNARGDDNRRIEGLISPGVHVFNPFAGSEEVLKQLLEQSQQYYEGTGLLQAAPKINLTPYQILTAASLLEREVPENDFPKGARVILNRLAINQKLEFDSTVNYGLEEQEVATTNEDRAAQTPWNTYAKEGLPDTPISSPSRRAMHAMENPEDGDWLYFVTVDLNGTTVFNHDFEAHQQAALEASRNGVLDSNR